MYALVRCPGEPRRTISRDEVRIVCWRGPSGWGLVGGTRPQSEPCYRALTETSADRALSAPFAATALTR